MIRHNSRDTSWFPFDYDEVTFTSTYVKFDENGLIHFRKTIPGWLADQILDENKDKAKHFNENGGWKGAKGGAVVAQVPNILDQQFKRASGYDPAKGSWYDQKKYNSFLDDPDYAYLRTGGGRIGTRKASV